MLINCDSVRNEEAMNMLFLNSGDWLVHPLPYGRDDVLVQILYVYGHLTLESKTDAEPGQ